MTSSKYIALCLGLPIISVSAEVIFSEDFENESSVGKAPYKASVLRPQQNEPGKSVVIVGETQNSAGSGKGVFLQDRLTGGKDAVSLEYDFVDSSDQQISAFRIDFGFARGGTKEKKKDRLYFGAGEYNGANSIKMNATARRYFQIEFLDDDTIKFNTASGKDRTVKIPKKTDNMITLFVNDHDKQSIEYAHPISGNAKKLPANSVAYYLNGQLAHSTRLDMDDKTASGTVGTSENNFGRMGFTAAQNLK